MLSTSVKCNVVYPLHPEALGLELYDSVFGVNQPRAKVWLGIHGSIFKACKAIYLFSLACAPPMGFKALSDALSNIRLEILLVTWINSAKSC